MNPRILPFVTLLAPALLLAAEPPEPKFCAVTIDDEIQIGYGLAVADVDGDKLLDILLADKKQIVWYRNPGPPKPGTTEPAPQPWDKFVIAENLTEHDNVCLAAQDIDGDGKCELAVGAEWNPGDTEKSGAVFYMIPPADRTQRWTPVKFPAVEPTTHRMKWIKLGPENAAQTTDAAASPSAEFATVKIPWGLVVVPLHGRGNKNGEGVGVRVLLYHPPTPLNDPKGEWKSELVDDSMHMTHNFEVIPGKDDVAFSVLLAGKEGVAGRDHLDGQWKPSYFQPFPDAADRAEYRGAGELRWGQLRGVGNDFFAAVEPMHGNSLVIYWHHTDSARRQILTEKLSDGHALACGNLLGLGGNEIVVGWRGSPGKADSTTGVAVWTPLDPQGERWRETVIDPTDMACEDLQLADLNGDGKLDVVASGRATKNVKIYFNETPR